jgi:epoxyqueuosine reductase QueG
VEHPILARIRREGFTALGWFEPLAVDETLQDARFVILIGNAGPDMFRRFARERDHNRPALDAWTKVVVDAMAANLDAIAVYPFDKPALPFLTWARRAGAGHSSPLGLNIHSTYGLWHAYRAALLFPVAFDLPKNATGGHPCETCPDKPCLSACPVAAFDGKTYDVASCGQFLTTAQGEDCMADGCKARLACPVGRGFTYAPAQMQFHMRAFRRARQESTS